MNAEPPTRLLFVYGTLRRGECNEHLMVRARFVDAARTERGFELFHMGWHPAMVRGGTDAVTGEVWEIDAATLAELDQLEQHPTWFQRTVIALADGRSVETYLLPRAGVAGRARIDSGDWKRKG